MLGDMRFGFGLVARPPAGDDGDRLGGGIFVRIGVLLGTLYAASGLAWLWTTRKRADDRA